MLIVPKKSKKTPLRKCLVSQDMFEKDQLIRIVKTKEGSIFVDPSGKKNGRGYYVAKDVSIIEKAEKDHILERHLQSNDLQSIYNDLKKVVNGESIE